MKRIRIKRNQTRSWWKQVFTTAGVVLLALFVYHTCQLYLDRKASTEQATQWRQDQIRSTAEGMGNRTEYEGKTYRRNTYVKAILCMGIDRTESLEESRVAGQGGQADGIFLIAQDTTRDKVKIPMIPRDTMMEITLTDLSDNELGRGIQHLAPAYAYGDGRKKSCQYMTDAVSRLFDGLSINGHMAFSMSVIPVVNDGVGGVAVAIKNRKLEKVDPDLIYGEGLTFRGKQAEAHIRYRDTKQAQSAIGRTERQKSYIEGFLKMAKKKAGRDDGFVPRILKEIEPYMIADMTKDRYLDMALALIEKGQDVGIGDMLTLPGNAVETLIYDEYYSDKDQTRPLILELFYRPEEWTGTKRENKHSNSYLLIERYKIMQWEGRVRTMRKRITTIALVAALVASQSVCTFVANSPRTGPVISDGGSDGSSYDAGTRTSTTAKTGTTANTVQSGGGVQTNSRGQAVVGDTALEFIKDTGSAVVGFPKSVVNATNGINSGHSLNKVVSGVDLTGYSALTGTQAIITKDTPTNAEKTGVVEVPMYIPNLVNGLGNVQMPFYNNLVGTWTVIQPTRIDTASRMLCFNIPNPGTASVICKR